MQIGDIAPSVYTIQVIFGVTCIQISTPPGVGNFETCFFFVQSFLLRVPANVLRPSYAHMCQVLGNIELCCFGSCFAQSFIHKVVDMDWCVPSAYDDEEIVIWMCRADVNLSQNRKGCYLLVDAKCAWPCRVLKKKSSKVNPTPTCSCHRCMKWQDSFGDVSSFFPGQGMIAMICCNVCCPLFIQIPLIFCWCLLHPIRWWSFGQICLYIYICQNIAAMLCL